MTTKATKSAKNETATTNTVTMEYNKEQKKDLLMVDPRLIIANEAFNVRHNYGDVDELAQSILENGVKMPLSGYRDGDNFVVTDGFRRTRAIHQILANGGEIARVPFMLEPKGYNQNNRIFDMFIKNDGKRLEPLEEGELFIRLENAGFTRGEIAKRVGRTEAHVSQMVKLANADPSVLEHIKAGEITATTASKIIKATDNPTEQKNIIKEGLAEAKKQGKKKVTDKHIEEAVTKTKKANNKPVTAKENAKQELKNLKTVGTMLMELEGDTKELETDKVLALREIVKFIKGEVRPDQLLDYFTN